MKIFLTGGAGFIGSHTAVVLLKAGYEVVIYDNFSNSQPSVIDQISKIAGKRPETIEGDIRDKEKLLQALANVDVVIHFAGLKAVAESVKEPLKYYENNVNGTLVLLRAMNEKKIKRIIFSSSSTVYGIPDKLPLTENSPTGGVSNPYGRTKLQIEEILKDICAADHLFSAVCLRYFNPIGAHESGLIGENPNGIPNNLLPYVAKVAHGILPYVRVFGSDYPTLDGTGVRDYIHVMDLAEGHALSIPYIVKNLGWKAINLGCGKGYSVLDIIHAFERASGKKIPYKFLPRRPGDIAANWCDPSLAHTLLHWVAKRDLNDMCRDSWNFELQYQKK
ncbi:UDP-glucose 4-epimerase GalE [Mesosutterella sp. OilRF-GAM-744-9]|uniref:UDP-glucose 4-epimerase n=2 Tax=Mesosutterella TaxID=2494213 RepID=A0ABS9MP43_9BURK|nr:MULTISPECIES: UDP-glucose 4-epimerase GalE [unclassified Mesosutterella]MCG5030380.1 UDP-glucose 4-epimerase GalE [Mesosutterella sp. oilRF-744-WT-GAM-9]MDL2059469.1 UDP-glucose 4-epimerase GalE [Mesosutterella sp. AGMB02718]